ncbi:general transcription factor 3C polypeptide 5 [Melitaea cinxia]|uniref:general transcription factor 3C polypeptide 5 n=1 Tax=Melitaea cinxia TaxID=113334 RepID=UPI001E272D74|nr:general transcription factor 3C polypeptide 5 [Melitaea cinxia]
MDNMENLHKELFCVLFPGNVKNDDKAIQCLGGVRAISQVYMQANKKRLGLSFQPDNPFMKKIYADAKPTSGVLLKLKVKKTKSGDEVKREILSTSVVGSVKRINKFESMSDFQYLPISASSSESDDTKCVLEEIIPSGVDSIETLLQPAPSFVTPFNFTRSDKPIAYCYTDKRYSTKEYVKEEYDSVINDDIHKSRSERGIPIPRYLFNLSNDLPIEPNEYYLKQKKNRLAIYPQLENEFKTVAKLFEERPIWSLNLLKFHTKIRMSSLRIILPCLAIYMREGPWRMMWVKYGYDPRKDPEARIYQTLDFRMRHAAGVHTMVMTRDQVVHCKKTDRIRSFKKTPLDELSPEDIVLEGAVCFRPGMVPSQRQIYYQYHDVQIPEVQELISRPPAPGARCHEKRGWLPPDIDNVCRDHIFRYVKQTLLATHKADLKFEDASSGDDSGSDGDDANKSVADLDESSASGKMDEMDDLNN